MVKKRFYENKIYCSNAAKHKVSVQVRDIFLLYHPELKDRNLSLGYLLEEAVDYYIRTQ